MLDPDQGSRIAATQHTAQITANLIEASKKTVLGLRTAILETQRKISSTKELLRTQEEGDQSH